MAKKRIDQLPELGRDPKAGDLVHLWDADLNRSTKADVSSLVGGGGGGGGDAVFTSVASPFPVTTTTDGYSYDAGTNIITFRDTRLLNKTQYPILATQFGGGVIDFSKIIYTLIDPDDDTKGMVQISGFELDADAQLWIITPGDRDISGDAVYTALLADVALLKQMAAPFKPTALGPNGGKVWWPAAAGEIPAGWQECLAMRGYLPMAQDPDDAYDPDTNPEAFGRPIGTTSGDKYHTNTIEEMAPHAHELEIPSRDLANFANAGPDLTHDGVGDTRTFTTEESGGVDDGAGHKIAKQYSIMNPHLLGIWIEFVGI